MEKTINLKEKILFTAKEFFKTKGYLETSIGEIIKEANTSRGNLYHHFDSKEALFLEVFEQETKQWITSWNQYLQDNTVIEPIEKIYKLADFCFGYNFDQTLLQRYEEFYTINFKSIETNKKLEKINQEFIIMYKELLLECQEAELIDSKVNIDDLTLLFMSLFSGIDYHLMTNSNEKKNLYRLAVDVFMKGVLTERKL